jgi:hypothetical protein
VAPAIHGMQRRVVMPQTGKATVGISPMWRKHRPLDSRSLHCGTPLHRARAGAH